ncbi:MAG TPA: aldehyde ferredoxin oxidoreductase family protein, partial [Candidatus Bathyarchaeia archaeon]|nr:aldehyde ferredoxin oxidoreductase family protein [Candidatus Bathyarchaeia archaeon]
PELRYAGYDAIVIRGKASKPVYIDIDDEQAVIRDASSMWGKSTFDAGKMIQEDLDDPRAEAIAIGQAGENLVKYAGIFTAAGRFVGKAAARCGMGTVMGSKNLKAIAVRGTKSIEVANLDGFMKTVEEVRDLLRNDKNSSWLAPTYGTWFLVKSIGANGALVTRNFQTGVFERENEISGDALREKYLDKARACFGCPLRCSHFVKIETGPFAGLRCKGPEFESISMLGSNCGLGEADAIIAVTELCDAVGVDSISCGNVIGFAMELYQRGILSKEEANGLDLSWGNYESMIQLIKDITYRKGFGNILAEGVRKAAELIGRGSEAYAMHTKGLEHIGGDPRGQSGFALGYATCNRGGDHLGALPVFEYMGRPEVAEAMFGSKEAATRFGVKGKGRLVKWQEDLMSVIDSMGVCKCVYAHYSTTFDKILAVSPERLPKLFTYATGIEISTAEMLMAGERMWNLERAFNVREGLTRKDDTLPDRFLKEPFKEGASAGSVVKLEPMLDEYYEARNWDKATGNPTREKLVALGLDDAARDLFPEGQ